ncbi:MAG: hypothetical protein RR383_02990 [Muribaculaceae bacterium]
MTYTKKATEGYLYLLKARLNKLRYENEEAINNGKLAVKYGINKTIVDKAIK